MSQADGFSHLISLINKLQDAFSSMGLPLSMDLPQIAVVGSQSAGKSSVLENFVGRDFLPRGSGIVTRRPLVLQLIPSNTEYGEFLHQRNKRYSDFNAIRTEIEVETDRVTGKSKGISNIPINLRIYSPNVLNLTMIDLPGLTKNPVGDQPADIETQIRNIILEYIGQENCLILAVSPANSDLANSDALKLAREVDPQCTRTIGVITKLDLMDHGTDARDILENKFLPLRRGYVGVVNRSQRDIDSQKDIHAALEGERQYFLQHPAYKHMADRLGTPHLQRVLNQQLTNHIKEVLPSLRSRLQSQLYALEKQVQEFKNFRPDDPSYQNKALLSLVHQFDLEVSRAIDGQTRTINTQSLCGGARINRLFHERYPYELVKAGVFGNRSNLDGSVLLMPKEEEISLRREIRYAIMNIHGIRSGIFTPDMAFEAIIERQIERLRSPSHYLVELVAAELFDIVKQSSSKMVAFPYLRDLAESLVLTIVRESEDVVKSQIDIYLQMQRSYTNTNHEDFIGFANAEKGAQKPSRADVTSQIIRKGRLTIQSNFLRGREFWFVLRSDQLAWYKDEEEKERHYVMPLEDIVLREMDSSFFGRRFCFTLFHNQGRNIYKDLKQLELSSNSFEDNENWKASFLRAGVYPNNFSDSSENVNGGSTSGGSSSQSSVLVNNIPNEDEITSSISRLTQEDRPDPHLERQVEVIRALVESYMRIVNKTQRDLMPKMVTHFLINRVKNYIKDDLIPSIYTSGQKLENLISITPDQQVKRQELLRTYDVVKEALTIINEVNNNTTYTPVPPMVKDDWSLKDIDPSSTTTNTTGAFSKRIGSSRFHESHSEHNFPRHTVNDQKSSTTSFSADSPGKSSSPQSAWNSKIKLQAPIPANIERRTSAPAPNSSVRPTNSSRLPQQKPAIPERPKNF